MIQTNQALREPRSIMDVPTLERLCKELVTLCDSVERHGLVDYQMGVSEEEIMECEFFLRYSPDVMFPLTVASVASMPCPT